jgi:hypothetical protein
MEQPHSAVWLIMRFIIRGIMRGKSNAIRANTINPPVKAPNKLVKKILFMFMVKGL